MNSTPGAAVELLRPGSLLLRNPETIVNPFYHMAPRWALYPLVVMATMATIIASQAVISGAFSLTVQAIQRWHWPVASTLLLCGGFLIFDCAFLGANFTKISHGGWFPLLVALLVFATMSTWKQGRKVLAERLRVTAAPLTQFVEHIESFSPRKVPGTTATRKEPRRLCCITSNTTRCCTKESFPSVWSPRAPRGSPSTTVFLWNDWPKGSTGWKFTTDSWKIQ